MTCLVMDYDYYVKFLIVNEVPDNFTQFEVDKDIIILSEDYNGKEFTIYHSVCDFNDIDGELWILQRTLRYINRLNKIIGK